MATGAAGRPERFYWDSTGGAGPVRETAGPTARKAPPVPRHRFDQ
ncbi:hypothetical protein ACFYLX_01330 [Pseudarthrobacter enclensis]